MKLCDEGKGRVTTLDYSDVELSQVTQDWTLENLSGRTELVVRESDDIGPEDTIAVRFVTESVELDENGYLRDCAKRRSGSEYQSDPTGIQTRDRPRLEG
jgi:hypothetical protein